MVKKGKLRLGVLNKITNLNNYTKNSRKNGLILPP